GHDVVVEQTVLYGRGGRNVNHVVPRNLGDGFGRFLEPTVVGKAAVIDGGVGAERDFQVTGGDGRVLIRIVHLGGELERLRSRAGYDTGREPLGPGRFEAGGVFGDAAGKEPVALHVIVA